MIARDPRIGNTNHKGRSRAWLTEPELIALRARVAEIGSLNKSVSALGIGGETLRTLLSGGPVQSRTLKRVQKILSEAA